MSDLRKGQTVSVTFNGEVVDEHLHSGPSGDWIISWNDSKIRLTGCATVEPIEDLRPGDVYRDPGGYLLIYSPEQNVHPDRGAPIGWHVREDDGSVRRIIDSVIQRPLTLLVRDGQPVTS